MHQVIWAPPGGAAPGALGHDTYLIPTLCLSSGKCLPSSGNGRVDSTPTAFSHHYLCPRHSLRLLQRLYSNALQYYYTTVTWLRAIAVILVFHSRRGCERFCSPLTSTNQATNVTAPSSCLYTPSPPPWMDGTCR